MSANRADIQVRDRKARRGVMEAISRQAAEKAVAGAEAARSQDFLYDAEGLPEAPIADASVGACRG